MDEKLFVLGFDGMDIHILKEAMERRDLPNFERLKEEGVLGTLESTHPPVTIPAWISMFTGKDPGKLGAFHFQRLNRETGKFEPVDVSQYFGTYVWDAGIESALLFVPGTSPPYEINGRMAEGIPGPDDFSTYPADLKDEVLQGDDRERLTMEWKAVEDYWERIMTKYRVRKKVVRRVIDNHEQELFIAVYRPTDYIPHNTEDVEELYDLYEEMDEELGFFLDRADAEAADLIVVSDHGTSRVKRTVFINTWLHEHGYLALTEEGKSAGRSPLIRAASFLVNHGLKKPLDTLHSYLRYFTGVNLKPSRHAVSEQVEWGETKALSHLIGAPPSTGITLNENILSGEELEEVRDRLIQELEAEEFVRWVKPREEVYRGDRVEELPHLVVRGEDDVMMKSNLYPETVLRFDNLGHGYDGILGAYGPSIAPGGVDGAAIPDVAPTLMHLLGRPVPEDMDGEVLNILAERGDVATGEPIDVAVETTDGSGDDEIKDRLEELGYMRD